MTVEGSSPVISLVPSPPSVGISVDINALGTAAPTPPTAATITATVDAANPPTIDAPTVDQIIMNIEHSTCRLIRMPDPSIR